MISAISGLPSGVIGFEASGQVTGSDYEEVLIPALETATADDARTRLMLVFGADFEGYEMEAVVDDMKVGGRTWGDFEKIAFVTDHSVYRGLVRAFGVLMPGEVKVFPLAEMDAAKQWVAA